MQVNTKNDAAPLEAAGANKKRNARKHRASNGCGCLILKGTIYHARWSIGNHLVQRSLNTSDIKEARAKLAALSVQRTNALDRAALRKITQIMSASLTDISDASKVASIPINAMFDYYTQSANRASVRPSSLAVQRSQFTSFTTWLHTTYPSITNARDISQSIADAYAIHRNKTAAPRTVLLSLATLSQIWNILKPKFALEYNPWTSEHIARPRHLHSRNPRRALTAAEIHALLSTANLEDATIIKFALYAGLRLSDIIDLQWQHIDLTRGWINKTQIKTSRPVSVPIAPALHAAIIRWKDECAKSAAAPSPYLFPHFDHSHTTTNPIAPISAHFIKLFAAAGIELHNAAGRATFHSLRHTFVSNLANAGVSPLIIKDAAGHSALQTTEGYTHIGENALRAAFSTAAKQIQPPPASK